MSGVRIAMWSGPRNISTALMRSWSARADTAVCDEPLYGHYLKETGADHPGAKEIIATSECDWRAVVEQLTGPIPDEKPIWYQKHMAHHLLPMIDRSWLGSLKNCILVRKPGRMLASLAKVLPEPTAQETGLPQQLEMYREIEAITGTAPPVVVSSDVLKNPSGMLRAICNALDVPYSDAMLRWESGPRATDGVWAPHWYSKVERSSGFAPYSPSDEAPPERLSAVLAECERCFDELLTHRLTAE